jgi:hypothetical protein
MANTIVQRTLVGGGKEKNIIREIALSSDGTQETNLVVYDNSTLVNNVLKGRLMRVEASGSDCLVTLSWDQTTDVVACSFNPMDNPQIDFTYLGGVKNPGAAGATGDLLLTTVGLASTERFTIFLHITQN